MYAIRSYYAIILHLYQGDKRYSELVKLLPDISERMLTKQLKELEVDGIISRTVFPEVPPRVEYSLTNLGRDRITSYNVCYTKLLRDFRLL